MSVSRVKIVAGSIGLIALVMLRPAHAKAAADDDPPTPTTTTSTSPSPSPSLAPAPAPGAQPTSTNSSASADVEAFVKHSIDPPQYGAALPQLQLPAPFGLPELTHSRFDAQLDWYVGSITPKDRTRGDAIASIIRPSIETSVFLPRKLYVGATFPFAIALPPDGGLATGETGVTASGPRSMLGNVEGYVRAVFALPTFLDIGFMLGAVAPTATFDREHRPNRSASDAANSLDPTNYPSFLPGRVTLRPAGDLRILRGPIVFQGRHGLDITIDDIGLENVQVSGRLLAHVGFLVRRDLEVSLEATQVYFFASDDKVTGPPTPQNTFAETYRISDGHRGAFTAGPGIRFAYRDVDYGASLITNLGSPLSPVSDHFFGLHVSVIGHVGTTKGDVKDR